VLAWHRGADLGHPPGLERTVSSRQWHWGVASGVYNEQGENGRPPVSRQQQQQQQQQRQQECKEDGGLAQPDAQDKLLWCSQAVEPLRASDARPEQQDMRMSQFMAYSSTMARKVNEGSWERLPVHQGTLYVSEQAVYMKQGSDEGGVFNLSEMLELITSTGGGRREEVESELIRRRGHVKHEVLQQAWRALEQKGHIVVNGSCVTLS